MGSSGSRIRRITRSTRTEVFPEPAAAETKTSLPRTSIAWLCWVVQRRSADIVFLLHRSAHELLPYHIVSHRLKPTSGREVEGGINLAHGSKAAKSARRLPRQLVGSDGGLPARPAVD